MPMEHKKQEGSAKPFKISKLEIKYLIKLNLNYLNV